MALVARVAAGAGQEVEKAGQEEVGRVQDRPVWQLSAAG